MQKPKNVTLVKLWQISIYEEKTSGSLIENFLTPWQPMRCSLGSILKSCNVLWQGGGDGGSAYSDQYD